MLLKDKLKTFFNNNSVNENIKLPFMDGFVDIKAYQKKDGKRSLVYHDCGDNVVTDWMRHAIMMMLTGNNFSSVGYSDQLDLNMAKNFEDQITMPASYNHTGKNEQETEKNYDGYILNGHQYFFSGKDITEKYSKSMIAENKYAYFPTKILFGTGKEYSSWDVLQAENESANAYWYTEMLNSYGGNLAMAKTNFDNNIDLACNKFSGSISKNIYSGNGSILRTRTVNDPDATSSIISTTSTMFKNYGVVGAIKTPYFSKDDDVLLQSTESDAGRLLKPINRGIGRPCFIYLNTPKDGDMVKEGWSDSKSSEVALSKDESSLFLNKITFTVTMPEQGASNNSVGEYYPYNGYTLKQMGLYNDCRLTTTETAANDLNNYPYLNMPCGMLLAVKNITAFEKTADSEIIITWTLTI